jgi:quinol monooxygenase YgiN
MTVQLIISFVVKSERVGDFVARTEAAKELLATVPGCEGVRIFQDAEHSARFTFLEAWTSLAHHSAHFENMKSTGEWDKLIEFLAADPVSSYCREL